MRQKGKQGMRLASFLLAILLLPGCSGGGGGSGSGGPFDSAGNPVLSDPEYNRTPPPIKLAAATGEGYEENYEGGVQVRIDTGNAASGYVGASISGVANPAIFVVTSSAGQSVYPLRADGQYDFFPLADGAGNYTLEVLVGTGTAGQYAEYGGTSISVGSMDELGPFLVNNKIVDYSASSAAIQFSYELTEHCSTDLEVVQVIYRWITQNIVYDDAKADRVGELQNENYAPNIDETLRTKTGICYDYAALAAAMLRANGIPTRLVKGNASNGETFVYHAWNEVWLDEEGWIAVKLEVNKGGYTRIDATFAAGQGSNISSFIGDGNNYYDSSYH